MNKVSGQAAIARAYHDFLAEISPRSLAAALASSDSLSAAGIRAPGGSGWISNNGSKNQLFLSKEVTGVKSQKNLPKPISVAGVRFRGGQNDGFVLQTPLVLKWGLVGANTFLNDPV